MTTKEKCRLRSVMLTLRDTTDEMLKFSRETDGSPDLKVFMTALGHAGDEMYDMLYPKEKSGKERV